MEKRPQVIREKPHNNSFRFATGLFAFTLMGQLFHAYNISYFVNGGLIDLFLATVCKILFVVTDSVNDLLFGMLSEKTKSRWGKRLPWIVGAAPFFVFFVAFMYFPNLGFNWSRGGFFAYYLIFSLMIENCSTILYTNYNATFPVMFTTTEERAKTSSLKHILEMVAMVICFVVTPILQDQKLLGLSLFQIGLIYGAIFLCVLAYCVTGFKHKTLLEQEEEDKKTKKYKFFDTLKEVLSNKSFILYNITQSFFNAILGVLISFYPMYCIYVLKTDSMTQGILMGVLFGSLLMAIPLWNKMINKYGFRRCYKTAYTLLPCALLLLAFPTNWWQGLIAVIIIGPCAAGLMITPDLMSTELIDIDKMKYGISREASFASIGSLISRISLIVSAIISAMLSFAFGYKSGTNPGPNPELAFRVLIGIFLAVIGALGTLFCYYYIKKSRNDSKALIAFKEQQQANEEAVLKNKKEEDFTSSSEN